MSRLDAARNSARCSARSKRTGEHCKGPAVRGWRVCRFHGARGGGPTGLANGNYRHGEFTAEAIETRHVIAELIRATRETLDDLP